MKKRFQITLVLIVFISCSIACQPGGGDFLPIPQENSTLESHSYNDKKRVFQVYNDEQILLKTRGQWDVENGASSFYIELTNKTQKDLVIEPNALSFNTNLDEKIVAAELTYTVTGNSLGVAGENTGNQKLKEDKLENGKIKIKGGQTAELDTGFYLNIKSFSKSRNYFLGKEVRFEIPIKFEGENEKVYKFAFKYDNYQ